MSYVASKQMSDRAQWESYVEGPRWARVGDAIRQSVLNYRSNGFDIRVDSLDSSKGLLRETVYFTVSAADGEVLLDWQKRFLDALRAYNR